MTDPGEAWFKHQYMHFKRKEGREMTRNIREIVHIERELMQNKFSFFLINK